MEVKVLEAEGITNDSIIMIRAGPMRRQAKLNAGLPFQFPSLPLNANPFKVEVFQPLGSKSLMLSPDAESYVVNLPATEFAQSSKIQLEIKDTPVGGTGATEGPVAADPALPPQIGDDLDDGSKKEDQILSKKDQNDRADKAKAEAALAAKSYLHKHDLVNFVQEMLTTVLKEKPFDPYRYMRDYARGQLPKEPEAQQADEDDKFGEDDSNCGIDGASAKAPEVSLPGCRVPLKYTVEGVDYPKLEADTKLKSQVVTCMQTVLAKQVNLDERTITMDLSAGSVKVAAMLAMSDLKTATTVKQNLDMNKDTLRLDIVTALQGIEGLSSVSNGTIECTPIEILSVESDDDNTKWYQKSQQALALNGESCTLTISEDAVNSRIRFDVFIPAKDPPSRWVVCSQAEFDDFCKEANGKSDAERRLDAIMRLFSEEFQENRALDSFESTPEPRAVSASVSPESEIAHQLARMATDDCAKDACVNESMNAVSPEEPKADDAAEKALVPQPPKEPRDPAASRPQNSQGAAVESRELPAAFEARELPPGLGMEEATTTASAPQLEATPPDKPKPAQSRPSPKKDARGREAKMAQYLSEAAGATDNPAVAAGLRQVAASCEAQDARGRRAMMAQYLSEAASASGNPGVAAGLKQMAASVAQEALPQPQPSPTKSPKKDLMAKGKGIILGGLKTGQLEATLNDFEEKQAEPADAAQAAEASTSKPKWHQKPSVGTWQSPKSYRKASPAEDQPTEVMQQGAPEVQTRSIDALLEAEAKVAEEAPQQDNAARSAADLIADNDRLSDKNEALRLEIARLKARLGESESAVPATATASAIAPATTALGMSEADKAAEEAAVAAAKKVLAEEKVQASSSSDPLLFDSVLDKCVGELYQEHKKKNEELRASYNRLASENSTLVQEQDRMKQMLLRLCYGLEGMATDIRAAVGEPTFMPKVMKSSNLEAENKDLRQNIVAMYEANRKLRSDNATLCSELSSRGVSRAASATNAGSSQR